MKIMAALDLSDYADFVLKKAIKTALQQNAKLDILVVAEKKRLPKAEQLVRSYRQRALDKGVKTKMRVRTGLPADEIIKYQKSEGLDLIVLGRRSRKIKSGNPMGAVAQKVAAYATSTVMIVRCMEDRDFPG